MFRIERCDNVFQGNDIFNAVIDEENSHSISRKGISFIIDRPRYTEGYSTLKQGAFSEFRSLYGGYDVYICVASVSMPKNAISLHKDFWGLDDDWAMFKQMSEWSTYKRVVENEASLGLYGVLKISWDSLRDNIPLMDSLGIICVLVERNQENITVANQLLELMVENGCRYSNWNMRLNKFLPWHLVRFCDDGEDSESSIDVFHPARIAV